MVHDPVLENSESHDCEGDSLVESKEVENKGRKRKQVGCQEAGDRRSRTRFSVVASCYWIVVRLGVFVW